MDASAFVRGLGDTIVAASSAPGIGSRAIVRLSGSRASEIVHRWYLPASTERTVRSLRRGVTRGQFVLGRSGTAIPVMVLVMRAPRSYTGEDQVEIHLPGHPRFVEMVQDLCERRGARPAAPGEFSLRALFHGKRDLARIEAVGALIQARDRDELRAAIDILEGRLSRGVARANEEIQSILQPLELGFDFSDQDIEIEIPDDAVPRLVALATTLRGLVADQGRWRPSRARPQILLVGPPNAGKSSLFNALTHDGSALVSPHAGTTRDVLEGTVDLEGFRAQATLLDTAGEGFLGGEADDLAHALRVRAAAKADLLLRVTDGRRMAEGASRSHRRGANEIEVFTHADLVPASARPESSSLWVSNTTKEGLAELRAALGEALRTMNRPGSIGDISRRHGSLLTQTAQAIERAARGLEDGLGAELIAADLHEALRILSGLTGAEPTQELLTRIMSTFCVGK